MLLDQGAPEKNFGGVAMSHSTRRDWRELCEEILKAKDTECVDDLLEELLDVLEERARTRGPQLLPQSES
jgi:hypothetical protein